MKKLTSVVLSVLLVISLFSCLLTGPVSAAASSGELITNGDFESEANTSSGALGALYGLNIATFNATRSDYVGKWYRATGGNSPSDAPDLLEGKTTPGADDYPYYFGRNDQRVAEPGNAGNHVMRAVQNLYQMVAVKENSSYSLSFRFKVPCAEATLDEKMLIGLLEPDVTDGTQISNRNYPALPITSATVSGTDGLSTYIIPDTYPGSKGSIQLSFDGSNSEWQNVTLNFTTGSFYSGDLAEEYGEPLIVLNFSWSVTDTNTINGFDYSKAGTYFDDISLKETIDCVAAAEFYNKDGKIATPNDYAAVSLQVGGQPASTVFAGDSVTATVDYDKESGAYRFLGWYKNGVKVSAEESITFTAADGEVYTPHFGSANILTSSASFEGFASGTNRNVENKTDLPANELWGSNKGSGYYGGTVGDVTIYDKAGNAYTQVAATISETVADNNTATLTVTDEKYHTGTNSLKLVSSYGRPASMGFQVEKDTDYTLSYYWWGSTENSSNLPVGTAVVSTVNVGNGSQPTTDNSALDASKLKMYVQNATTSDSAITLCRNSSLGTSDGAWKKVTLSFNSGSLTTVYLVFAPAGNEKTTNYIDDLICTAKTDSAVPVTFENTAGETIDGSNEYAVAEILDNFDGTSTATVDYDRESGAYTFKGWYQNSTLLSENEVFTFNTGAYNALTAVITSKNILASSASFESTANGTYLNVGNSTTLPYDNLWGSNKNGGYYGATISSDEVYDKDGVAYTQPGSDGVEDVTGGARASVANDQVYTGNQSLKLAFNWRNSSLGIDVTPNTDYVLSYYWYTSTTETVFEKLTSNQLKTAVVSTVNIGNGSTATANDGSNKTLPASPLANMLYQGSPIVLDTVTGDPCTTTGGEWKKVTLSFNSGNLDKVYLVISPTSYNGKKDDGTADDRALGTVWVDDLVCQAETPALPESITELIGTAIRTTGTQALRYKFSISKDIVKYGLVGYDLVEYGSIAIRTDYLGGAALTKDGVYNYNDKDRNPVVGVAYDKEAGKNILFDETDTDYVFTAALTNIGYSKTTGETNYAAWGYDYSVRNYAVFKDTETGELTTVYDETTAVASVFAVMDFIEASYEAAGSPTEGQLYDDYLAIQTVLGDTESEPRLAYAAWKAQ